MEPPTKPVMDIASPLKVSASNPPLPPKNAASAAPQANRFPAPGPVHPAPAVAAGEEREPQSLGSKLGDTKSKLPLDKAKAQPAKPQASSFPKGIVALTVIVMIVLASLAVAVYYSASTKK